MRENFDNLHWVKKIDERVNHEELVECITMLTEMYTDRAQSGLDQMQQ